MSAVDVCQPRHAAVDLGTPVAEIIITQTRVTRGSALARRRRRRWLCVHGKEREEKIDNEDHRPSHPAHARAERIFKNNEKKKREQRSNSFFLHQGGERAAEGKGNRREMSSETSLDDYEVDVAPMPVRSKSIWIEDDHHHREEAPRGGSPTFQLNPKVQFLTQHGKVQSLHGPRQLERLCPSVESRQLVKMLHNAELPPSATAEEVLTLLRDSFNPIAEFAYQHNKPSHAWAKGAIETKALHRLLMELCKETERILHTEPMLLHFDANPAYVLGDVHGNYKDLMQVSCIQLCDFIVHSAHDSFFL